MVKKTFSFDAETNGLWGQAFAIGALVYENGLEMARFVGRCPIQGEINPWVNDNVLPQIKGITESHGSYDELLKAFSEFYLANKADSSIIVHMGVPVESTVLKDMHSKGYIGDWDGPFPLIDISGNLQQAGENPASVDEYVAKYDIVLGDYFEGGAHNPLYDAAAAAAVYEKLIG